MLQDHLSPRSTDSETAPKAMRLEESLVFRLSRLVRVRSERWIRQLGQFGMTAPQAAILRATRDHQGISLRALSRTLNSDVMSIKRCVDDLEFRDLIETASSEADRRVRGVSLTRRGRLLVSRIDAVADVQEGELLQQLSPAQHRSLHAILGQLERAEGISSSPIEAESSDAE